MFPSARSESDLDVSCRQQRCQLVSNRELVDPKTYIWADCVGSSVGAMSGSLQSRSVIKSLFVPDSSLQGAPFPAHVMWEQSENVEVTISFPDPIRLEEVYNAPPKAITKHPQSINVSSVEVPGYLGLLFKSPLLTEGLRHVELEFVVKTSSGVEERYSRAIDLFRPVIQTQHVPDVINIRYDAQSRTYTLSDRIRLMNVGDGTAIVGADLFTEGKFTRDAPIGVEQFEIQFRDELKTRLEVTKTVYPDYAALLDAFVDIVANPVNLSTDAKNGIQLVFANLQHALENDKRFAENFVTAIGSAYLKNLELITEMRSFRDYLNSVGVGRVFLLNAVEVFRLGGSSGVLPLRLWVTDLAMNDYPPIDMPILLKCDGVAEIPIHILFDWGREGH